MFGSGTFEAIEAVATCLQDVLKKPGPLFKGTIWHGSGPNYSGFMGSNSNPFRTPRRHSMMFPRKYQQTMVSTMASLVVPSTV